MKKLIIAICCLAGFTAGAQNSNLGFKYALRFSNTTTVENYAEQHAGLFNYKSRLTTWVAPSLSFIIKNKQNNFHEIELTGIGVNNSDITDNTPNSPIDPYTNYSTTSHVAFQYQYIQNFLKNKNSKWMPSLGVGVSSDIRITNSGYYNSSDKYHSSYKNLTFIGFIAPAISYSLSKKFFVTASIPVSLFYSYSSFGKAKSNVNPQLFQDYEDNYFTAFPSRFSFKFGLGYKL